MGKRATTSRGETSEGEGGGVVVTAKKEVWNRTKAMVMNVEMGQERVKSGRGKATMKT